MLTRRSIQIVLTLLCVTFIASCGGNADKDVPLIFAAASLADVLAESAEIYEKETGKRVEFNFGGSITLANQIAKLDAPVDGVFFVGELPELLLGDLVVPVPNGRIGLVNTLVVIAKENAGNVRTVEDLAGSDSRIAIGDPVLAPVGRFAKQALESASVWDEIKNDLIFTADVRAALAAVETGNSTYGIVYRTDAMGSDSVSIVSEIYDGYSPVVYAGRTLADARNALAAKNYFDFISESKDVQNVFESAGFTVGFSGP
ncbi:MAG: molybdate ABC transporter substrate-binding protein [Dehalococcoidia bacterium]|jgi:molybdate transport system substrate-binding protein|nr:molybdate ABC transporter substrate-binding protein [Dehalococcoidia bacterium]